jgi:CRISPR-associated endonuclease/helicase Cas3
MKAKRVQLKYKIYYQTLNGHTEDCLKILKTYFIKKGSVLKSFCRKWEMDEKLFKKNLFLAVAFHDIGKLTNEFQNNIAEGRSSKDYPHPFFALPILDKLPFDKFDDLPIPIFAIMGHHTQLHRIIYDSVNRTVTYLIKEILEFGNHQISAFYTNLNFKDDFHLTDILLEDWDNPSAEEIKQKFIFIYSRMGDLGSYKTKSIFTYFFSILQLCDDYSSANFRRFIEDEKPEKTIYDSVLEDPEKYIYDLEYSESEFQKILFKDNKPYLFQNALIQNGKKFSFLFAPCGRGKTEAALLWAYQMKKKYNCDRIIFALPTQVTCNAMYERFVDEYEFGDKNVGLFHGKSFIALKYRQDNKEKMFYEDVIEESDEKKYDILKDETFKGNVFFKPITVTTIDHLAYSLVHGFSQSDFASGNLQNSIIIFDEVHYYETHTLNVLLRLFCILRKMEIPHLLMTGTAPDFLLNALNRKKELYSIVKDNEGLKFEPFTIVKNEENILKNENVFCEIKSDYLKNKKIFIILNQVEWVQNFYIELKKYLKDNGIESKIILYHSRFIYKDRVKKEKEIKELVKSSPCIVIATQVIEISLNISSDVMYSQIAPPDAIGQRAGRLNRSGNAYKSLKYYYEMKLFDIEKYKPYCEKIVKSSWNNFEEGPISYQSIKEVCDKVYNNVELNKDGRYWDFFEKNILFGNRPKEIAYDSEDGNALKIRDTDYQTIDVIPQMFECELFKNNNLIVEYKCRIPYYYYNSDSSFFHIEENKFKEKLLFCDYPYSYELGLQKNNYENIEDRIY